MTSTALSLEELTLNLTYELHVHASLEATFEALLEQMGPANETPDGTPLAMKIEPWPGGRWFRDLGNDNGHFWGNVQAIKRPTLLEITGPLFLSAPVVSNLQYRLRESDGGTSISFRHSAFGVMPEESERVSPRVGRRCWSASASRPKEREKIAKGKENNHMSIIDSLLQELEQETQTTRRVLERVPEDRLAWKPHPKSMSLGELALHVATVPGSVAEMSRQSPFPEPKFVQPSAKTAAELIPALEQSVAKARQILLGMNEAALADTWRLVDGSQREIFAIPVGALLRSIMLNHWYHHRGQLSVYLRELGVPVPSIYGPSADENPFVAQMTTVSA